ncbi:hypothetical protein CsatA_017778 [Cannabis sativa]
MMMGLGDTIRRLRSYEQFVKCCQLFLFGDSTLLGVGNNKNLPTVPQPIIPARELAISFKIITLVPFFRLRTPLSTNTLTFF